MISQWNAHEGSLVSYFVFLLADDNTINKVVEGQRFIGPNLQCYALCHMPVEWVWVSESKNIP